MVFFPLLKMYDGSEETQVAQVNMMEVKKPKKHKLKNI